MATKKIPTITTQFGKFHAFCKKMKTFNSLLIKMPNNIVILGHDMVGEDALPTENFAIWKDDISGPFYNWVCIDPNYTCAELKKYDVKIKGTEIIQTDDKLLILKDGKKVHEMDRLSGDADSKIGTALSHYRKMQNYLWLYQKYNYTMIDQEVVDTMISGQPITIDIPEYSYMMLAKSLFPAIKKEGTRLSFAIVDHDPDNAKMYVLFKEEHEDFDLYTLIAGLIIPTN